MQRELGDRAAERVRARELVAPRDAPQQLLLPAFAVEMAALRRKAQLVQQEFTVVSGILADSLRTQRAMDGAAGLYTVRMWLDFLGNPEQLRRRFKQQRQQLQAQRVAKDP